MRCKNINKNKGGETFMIANKKNVCVRLRPKTIEKLKKIAENKEMGYTELIRIIVENYAEMI